MKMRTIREISRLSKDVYVDRTVTGHSRGEGERFVIVKQVIHNKYKRICVLTIEELDSGIKPPKHDSLYVDPEGFAYHFLRKII